MQRNLVIIHRGPDYERDFDEIARKVNALDPGITVYHLPEKLKADLPGAAWQRPTLTVSLVPTFRLGVRRGPVLRNHTIAKLTQLAIFRRHGIPVPPALPFRFGMTLDPILFGDFVVVKPMSFAHTSHGEAVMLFRRRRLEGLRPDDLAPAHPLRSLGCEFQVQRYVHTGNRVGWHRVSTFFGKPLWSIRSRSTQQMLDLLAPDEAIERAVITNVNGGLRFHEFAAEPDVLALALKVHGALPEIPLLGTDILREERTGRLFVLEANPGGNTWHFSSPDGEELREAIVRDAGLDHRDPNRAARAAMIAQFGAFDVVAQVLARMTAERAA